MSKRWRFTQAEMDLIQDFVKDIDEDFEIVKGYAFECCLDTKEIFLGSKRFTKYDKYFMDWLKTLPEYVPINSFIISLLHEIGHFKTYNQVIYDNSKLLQHLYYLQAEDGSITEVEHQNKYFELPNEKNSTLWGLEYYKSHKTKCDRLAEMVGCTL